MATKKAAADQPARTRYEFSRLAKMIFRQGAMHQRIMCELSSLAAWFNTGSIVSSISASLTSGS